MLEDEAEAEGDWLSQFMDKKKGESPWLPLH